MDSAVCRLGAWMNRSRCACRVPFTEKISFCMNLSRVGSLRFTVSGKEQQHSTRWMQGAGDMIQWSFVTHAFGSPPFIGDFLRPRPKAASGVCRLWTWVGIWSRLAVSITSFGHLMSVFCQYVEGTICTRGDNLTYYSYEFCKPEPFSSPDITWPLAYFLFIFHCLYRQCFSFISKFSFHWIAATRTKQIPQWYLCGPKRHKTPG